MRSTGGESCATGCWGSCAAPKVATASIRSVVAGKERVQTEPRPLGSDLATLLVRNHPDPSVTPHWRPTPCIFGAIPMTRLPNAFLLMGAVLWQELTGSIERLRRAPARAASTWLTIDCTGRHQYRTMLLLRGKKAGPKSFLRLFRAPSNFSPGGLPR